jgi:hypothetical protein
MATVKTPFGQRQKKIDLLEIENERLCRINRLLNNDLEKMKVQMDEVCRELRRTSKQYRLLEERARNENMEYAEKQGFFDDSRKDRYNALETVLKSVETELSEKDEVCELIEIKSGDMLHEEGDNPAFAVFFKGSTSKSIWDYCIEEASDCLKFSNEKNDSGMNNISYGEVLDSVRFLMHKNHSAAPDTDHIFYDGAHYFILYFENSHNIDVGNIVRSRLQQYGLGMDNKHVKYLNFRKRYHINKMAEYVKINNQRISAIRDMGM